MAANMHEVREKVYKAIYSNDLDSLVELLRQGINPKNNFVGECLFRRSVMFFFLPVIDMFFG